METIKLDLIPGKKMPSLHASQYDDGRDYHIDLTENRVPYTLDGTETISLTVRKCDNTLVTMDIANVYGGKSYIEFRTTEQMNACAGFNYGEITIEKNGTQISSLNFYLQVEGAPDEGGITSQSEINNLKRQVHDAVVEELEDNGASETGYDNTESGLEATNVQDAIDEVNTKIENIPSVDAYTKEQSDEKYATKTELSDKADVSAIPTKTSQLQNDSGFAQIDDSEASVSKTYSSEKIETLLEDKANAENVDYMIEEETDVSTSTAFTKYPEASGNVYNGNNVRIESNANYDSYLLILNKATSIYFGGTLPAYVSICYGLPPVQKEADRDRWGCSSATRYRNLDSNLPTKATPLSVVKNGIIVITITKGATVSLFGLGLAYKFTDNASKQITDIINLKKPIITKDTTASGYVTERLYVHIPTKVGYVQYDFAHYVNASTNANTWNIRMTNAVDDDLTNRYLITTTGEFECAIKIDGAPDFMGGIAHGSEVITDIQFFIDGKKTTLANIVSGASFDELRVCVISNLYNPSDETTIVAEHSKEYIFNENGLTINQMVKWLGSYTLTDSYLAMFPSSKDVIDYLRVNNKIDTFTLSNTTPSIASGTNHAYSFGDNLLCDFDISTWEINAQTKSGVGAYFITDNGGQNYWKQYYKALASGTVANGDTWLTSTFYKIQIGA